MKYNTLKSIRIFLAIVIFLPVLLFFCDFADILPHSFSDWERVQLIPAVLSGSVVVIIALIVLTLLFGRIYCSVVCPMGVFQDIIAWFTKRGKKKNKKKRWYNYAKPYPIIRYSLLAICVVFLILGITTPLLLLDPYSNFGRIAVNLFRPIMMGGNNVVNWIALQFDSYNFYHVTIYTVTTISFLIALLVLLIVGIMSFLRGRLFCNTICPVGSILGLISKLSLFKVVLDDSKCTSCGLCEKACKSQCINSKEKTVDYSRCVTCFNCLDRCNKKGIKYKIKIKPVKSAVTANTTEGVNRRSFLLTTTAIAATFPLIPTWAQTKKEVDITKLSPITPPGSRNLKRFKEKCTACHLCITHCPMQILKPAGFNFGIEYAFKPHLVYYEMAFCNYECTACSEVCPNGAIEKLTGEEKKVTQIGIAQFEESRCIVFTENTSCGACSEHCPVQAIRMQPFGDNGLTIPHVHAELCVGCGGCESICPVRPIKAINILANEFHQTAVQPEEGEEKEINSDDLDFGF